MKLTEDGRTILRASYGRFHQGVLTGELSPFHPAASSTTTTAWNATTGGYTTPVSVVNPRRNLLLDADMRTPRTDEYSLGLDRELGRRLALAIAYIRKDGSDFIGWTDIGGIYREETRVLPNGGTLPVQVLTSPTADRRFLLTNPETMRLPTTDSCSPWRSAARAGGRRSVRTPGRAHPGCRCPARQPRPRRRSAPSLARRT